MPQFSRSWRLLQLLFPGAFETGTPQQLSPIVQPVWDAFRLTLGEMLPRAERQSTLSAGADFNHAFTGPTSKRIMIPLSLTVFNDGAAAAGTRVDVFMADTGTANDPWGYFAPTAPATNVYVGGCLVTNGAGAGGIRRAPIPTFVPWRNNLTANWRAPIAGVTCVSELTWLDVPGEILSLLPFVHEGSST